jgi:hypothetical protein
MDGATMPTGAAAVNLAIAEFKYADNAYGNSDKAKKQHPIS